MALENEKIISREDLKNKINELIKLVSDQSDILTRSNIDEFLNKALTRYKIWKWNGLSENKVTHPSYPKEEVTAFIPHTYHIPENHPLYGVDLSRDALLTRFKSNPDDEILKIIKDYCGLYIDHQVVHVPRHMEKRGKRYVWVEAYSYDVYKFYSPGGIAKCYLPARFGRFIRRPEIWWDVHIDVAGDYSVVRDSRTNPDIEAGGPSIRSLLIDRDQIDSYFTQSENTNLSIDENSIPLPDRVIEDSEMNIAFRALLHIFANIRMVTFQKQFNNRGNWNNVGEKIEIPIRIKNLKDITSINIDSLFQNINVDQKIIDNDDVIHKLNEIYEIWKNLPKQDILLRYCHDICHDSRGSWHW